MDSLLPKHVPLAETLAFLGRFPLAGRPRVLEVGCGTGDLALRLGAQGWQVLAIDKDPALVAVARGQGVDAVAADLRAFESEPFDAVLFANSLHHIDPLEVAVDRALRLLKPGGWLFVEDFAYDEVDRHTAAWLFDRRDLLEESGVLMGDAPRLQLMDPLERWRAHHQAGQGQHPFPSATQLREAVEERFKVLFTERTAYLYRYLAAELEPSLRGHRLAKLALEQERRELEGGTLRAVGLRIAARNED